MDSNLNSVGTYVRYNTAVSARYLYLQSSATVCTPSAQNDKDIKNLFKKGLGFRYLIVA